MTQTEILRELRKSNGRLNLHVLSLKLEISEERIKNVVERMPKLTYLDGDDVVLK